MIRPLGRALLALALTAGTLTAQVVTVPYDVLNTIPNNSTSYLYTGLDPSGTTMNVSVSAGGLLRPIAGTPGPFEFPGLWFGSNQSSATHTFTFNQALSYFELYITAQSTSVPGQYSEIFTNFTVNGGTPSFAFTNVSGTAWDGTNLTANEISDGRSILAISVGAGQSFSSISFDHVQAGRPEGSVVEQIRYQVASTIPPVNVVPEPSTYALMALGLLAVGMVSRRTRRER